MKFSRKFFMILMFVMLLVFSVSTATVVAQEPPEQSPFALVVMGTGYVQDDFDQNTWGGGLKLGYIMRLDQTKGLYVRSLYSRFTFGAENEITHSLDNALLLKWYAGRKWDVYLNFGASTHVGGQFSGTDPIGGFGLSRSIYTDGSGSNEKPFMIRGFMEIDLSDSDGQTTGNYAQINLGITLNKPEK